MHILWWDIVNSKSHPAGEFRKIITIGIFKAKMLLEIKNRIRMVFFAFMILHLRELTG